VEAGHGIHPSTDTQPTNTSKAAIAAEATWGGTRGTGVTPLLLLEGELQRRVLLLLLLLLHVL
jgi:hypothetical protein